MTLPSASPVAARVRHLIAFALAALLPAVGLAATATLRPNKDTTIYGNGPSLANGAGAYLLVGFTGSNAPGIVRSLIAFDLSSIPAGSTINSATLSLAINTPMRSNANTVQLRRVSALWGEGTSVANGGAGGGGVGGPATSGDATWSHRIFNTATWNTPGGDFVATVSASQRVSGSSGTATFTGAGLVADVQTWVNNSSVNFGWILAAQNEGDPAVRFSSRQGASAPSLVVDYTPGAANVAPTITAQPASQTVSAGLPASFTVDVAGTPAPMLQWRRNDVAISGATSATLTLPAVTAADAGSYTVIATNSAGSVTSAAATLTVVPGATGEARLSNLSVRAAMAAGQTLIVGFSVTGGTRSIVVRGVGPTLASFGLTGTMADPRLELYNDGVLAAQNDDWNNNPALSAAFASVGAFPLIAGSKDAALLQPIDGTRSVHLKGTGAGVALVELYDTGTGNTPRLINVSARNQVGTGDNILIFGFFIDGTGTKNVLIRAVGPRLADLGVTGVLADPKFEVFRAGGTTVVAANDNWDAALATTFSRVGAFPLVAGSKDAALVTTLAPGGYTVQVSGVNNTTGEALVEIYEVP